jgi:hypothetical protein
MGHEHGPGGLDAGVRVAQLGTPILTTGGNLVFAGGTTDRYFRAFDARTGGMLWQFRTNSGVIGVPSTFAVDGVQYVAVQSGWGVDAASMTSRIDLQRGHDHVRAAGRRGLGVRAAPLRGPSLLATLARDAYSSNVVGSSTGRMTL